MSDVSDNDAAILGKQSSPKRRKTKSSVWEHFTKESLSVGCTKARCKYCNQNFAYSNGSKNAGTSHLKRHLALGACPKYQNQGKSQLLLSFSPTTTETPSSPKVRKTKSLVWEHFNVESLVGCTKAHCKHCNQIFTCGNGSKITGTSHLKRHLTFGGCSKYQHKEKTQQLIPYTPIEPNGGSTSLSTFKFDQDRSHQDLAEMIILHEYPFHMVEDSGFINFVQNLQPEFKMVTSSTIKDDCLAIYEKEKQSVKQLLATIPGRISLTSEMWTLDQSLVYMCLVGHFIDSDWKFHKRILNFKLVSYSHTVNTLNNVVDIYLSDWNIETRIFTMTTNDCSMNDIHIKNLRDRLSNKNALLLNGRLFHVRSFSHILNLLVQDGFGMIPEIIQKIRECVKYIKGSQANEEKFAEIVQELEITNEKILCLDVQTQWDTTYVMLDTALELKQAFSRFYYDGAPSVDDWHKVEALCMYLKIFYDATNVFSKTTCPTANLFFHDAWKIQIELSHAATSEDVFVSTMMTHMQPKFDKYWKECSLVMAIAVIMDPRFKMKLVEFIFSKIYGSNADMHVKIVDEVIHDLYMEYATVPHSTPVNVENTMDKNVNAETFLPSGSDDLQEFDQFLSKMSSSQQAKSDLDQYLEEPLVPRKHEFDILAWWKLNTPKYPTLSKIAHDVLTIPMSTADPNSAFSIGTRVLDPHRSSLPPETAEALVCARDWLCNALSDSSKEIIALQICD